MSSFSVPEQQRITSGIAGGSARDSILFSKGIFTSVGVRRLLSIVACAAILLSPFAYIGNYAGDSQIHLVYGQNAAQGRFFEFNPGERSPGVSSPGYMLFIASLFTLFPETWVPAVVKASNILFWYGLLFFVFLLARQLLQSTFWASLATLAAGLLPGSVYNSTIGMENGIFAFAVYLWIYLAARTGWFGVSGQENMSVRTELILGFLLGLACWVRPEGFIISGLALSYRALRSDRSWHALTAVMVPSSIFLVTFLTMTLTLAYFHASQTGYLLPTSGMSRILMSQLAVDSFHFGPLFFSPKFTIRLAAYFPLTIFWLVGNWIFLSKRVDTQNSTGTIGFLIISFWTAFVLYSAVFGSVHLARYTIFAMPALVLVAMMGAKWLWDSWHLQRNPRQIMALEMGFVAIGVALATVFLVETNLRLQLDSQTSLWKSMQAPVEREAFSEELFDRLGRPEKLPVSVALQEVQARYWLDERFVVRSLDGRVDPALLDYATKESIDHIGYLSERRVQFLLDTPNYNRDPERWSLQQLNEMKPGEVVSHEGLGFFRLSTNRKPATNEGSVGLGGMRWFAGAEGPTVLEWFLRTILRIEHQPLGISESQ